MRHTPEYADRFGAAQIDFYGLLVIGRSESLDDKQRRRLKWREQKALVDSHQVIRATFDQVYQEMFTRLKELRIK